MEDIVPIVICPSQNPAISVLVVVVPMLLVENARGIKHCGRWFGPSFISPF